MANPSRLSRNRNSSPGQNAPGQLRSPSEQNREASPMPAPAAGEPGPSSPDVSNEEIARRAYSRWESSGRSHGQDQDHWFAAENELRNSGGRQSTGTTPTDVARGASEDL